MINYLGYRLDLETLNAGMMNLRCKLFSFDSNYSMELKLFVFKSVFVSDRVHGSAIVELMISGIVILIWNMFSCVENKGKFCRY